MTLTAAQRRTLAALANITKFSHDKGAYYERKLAARSRYGLVCGYGMNTFWSHDPRGNVRTVRSLVKLGLVEERVELQEFFESDFRYKGQMKRAFVRKAGDVKHEECFFAVTEKGMALLQELEGNARPAAAPTKAEVATLGGLTKGGRARLDSAVQAALIAAGAGVADEHDALVAAYTKVIRADVLAAMSQRQHAWAKRMIRKGAKA